MESKDKKDEYEQNVWEIYRREWATASSEKKVELNKRMRRWQELMKDGLTASQAHYRVMQEESNYRVVEEPSDKHPAIYSVSRMRKASLIFLGLALVATIVYGFFITGDRNAVNTELESVQSTLTLIQADLSSTKQILVSTQSELGSTKRTLTSTQQSLASTQAELSSTKQTLASTRSELTSTNQGLSSVQNELVATKTELDAIDAKLKLYEDTMGIKIFSGVQPPLRGAGPIELVNNSAATDPSWQQLMSFLRADPTDDRTWTEGIFVSGDFGEMLHNNAEAARIRAALVGVFFEGETIGHGLNAFKTTDRGLVYVDSTGPTFQQKLEEILYRTSIEWDKIAYVTKGRAKDRLGTTGYC